MSVKCECDKCGEVAISVKGKKHRRCGGSQGAKPKDKDAKIAKVNRGTWQ